MIGKAYRVDLGFHPRYEGRESNPLKSSGSRYCLRFAGRIQRSRAREIVEKTTVNLGKSEATAGLIFVCLSRTKRTIDLLAEPMPFDRLSILGGKLTFKTETSERTA